MAPKHPRPVTRVSRQNSDLSVICHQRRSRMLQMPLRNPIHVHLRQVEAIWMLCLSRMSHQRTCSTWVLSFAVL
eukprot:scaffold48876_cov40-Cyclotella_meneghiniana.AAC.5